MKTYASLAINNKIRMFFIIFSVVLGQTHTYATLIDYNNANSHVIYDIEANQYWIWDLTQFSGLSYSGQINKINDVYNSSSYYGISSWHMASVSEMSSLWLNSAVDLNKFNYNLVHGGYDYRYGRYESIPVTGKHYTASANYAFAWYPWECSKSSLETLVGFRSVGGSIEDENSNSFEFGLVSAWVTAPGQMPVPEPSTMILLGVGLCTCAVYGKRRKNNH